MSDRIFGEYRDCQISDIPRPCRDTGPPYKAGFVFLGFDSSVHQTGRESPDSARVALFACSVNAMSRRSSNDRLLKTVEMRGAFDDIVAEEGVSGSVPVEDWPVGSHLFARLQLALYSRGPALRRPAHLRSPQGLLFFVR